MLKRLKKSLSLTLVLALCMSFIACGSDGKSDDNFSDDSDSFEGRVKDSEQIAAQDNPNEGLGGGLNEDAVNDFSEFEGIWLGEANNEYDSMEIDSEGNWTLLRPYNNTFSAATQQASSATAAAATPSRGAKCSGCRCVRPSPP